MAKILDKMIFSPASKAIKLRQKYDWTKSEIDELARAYDEKKQRKLDNFIIKANKQLSPAMISACNKEDYAYSVVIEKLQKYDARNYLKQRAINHKAAKNIFKAIKSGLDWTEHIQNATVKISKLSQKRAAFVEKLELKKYSLMAALGETNATEYQSLYSTLESDYLALQEQLDNDRVEKVEKKQVKLEEKLDMISAQITLNQQKTKKIQELGKDVILSVRGLKMHFGGLKAVDDLSFDVKRGEIFGLIGPNGAGKTTVFNCITRFYDATDGDMYFENKYGDVVDLRDYKVHDVILQGISRTFQNIELVKEISVIENLLVAGTRSFRSGFFVHALGLPSLRKEEKIMRQKAMRILKFMGLESYANWLAFGLPYGILKKVEIARALMADAKLIIMDEPAAGLNDSETAELTETIRKIRDEFGVTILLVEHDMSLVMNVCDTVCAISFGQLLAIGTTDEIQKNKAVQEAYLGVEEDD